MDKKEIDICCKYGFSVNLLIDNLECFLEDIMVGEDITDEKLGYLKVRIAKVREYEEQYKQILRIE